MSRSQEPDRPLEDMPATQLVEYARNKERELNEANTRAERAERRAALATTTNLPQQGRPQKRTRVGTSETDNEENEESGGEEEKETPAEKATAAGRKYAIVHGLWLTSTPKKILQTKQDDRYREESRFTNLKNKMQGEMRDVRETLPEDIQPSIGRAWLIRAYRTGMQEQRSNTSSRIRNNINEVFEDHLQEYIDGPVRVRDVAKRTGWTNLIGGKRNAEKKMEYNIFDAAVLHADMSNTHNTNTFLKNKLPMHIAAAILYGRQKALALAAGTASATSGTVMKDIHQITHTTPGLAANASMLTLWALSADVELKPAGQQTGISWQETQEHLVVYLTNGLRKRMRSVIDIFRVWDEELFPHTETSLGGAMGTGTSSHGLQSALAAMESGERMDEDEEEGTEGNEPDGSPGNGSGEESSGEGNENDDTGS
ncbi:hypothetical protein GGX14DRAFT_391637 [Mycena pura]|uniref:Uncharacterized protein n=1 Tax=Mycena pura TaxID=153505 RepID=A0AAD6VPJ8_9AGAR|nr:hypothetical protein GGX14DRAFT_391637 [Mycena pura]